MVLWSESSLIWDFLWTRLHGSPSADRNPRWRPPCSTTILLTLGWQESKMAASLRHSYCWPWADMNPRWRPPCGAAAANPGLKGIQDGGLYFVQLLLILSWQESKMVASLQHNYTIDPGLTGIQDGGLPAAQLLLTLGWHESKMAASMWRSCC